jgi:hypothetical protein
MAQTSKHFVFTNDQFSSGNSTTLFEASGTPANPNLGIFTVIDTGGLGATFSAPAQVQVIVAEGDGTQCLFLVDGGSNDVDAMDLTAGHRENVGTFKGGSGDDGGFFGMALTTTGRHVYAAFTGSSTIATYKITSGCSLTYIGSINASGINGGPPLGIAAHGSIMVITYGDGSIESFNIQGALPVSNGDLQLTTGFTDGNGGSAAGVQITSDSHYAVFADATAAATELEVSDISSGKLASTIDYGGQNAVNGSLGAGQNSNFAWLSPDETLVYVSNTYSGQVTGVKFNRTTGILSYGCISGVLKGFGTNFLYPAGLATANTAGNGAVVWVAEYASAPAAYIGMVTVGASGGTCTLSEAPNSPAEEAESDGLESIAAFPPRPF